MRLHAARLALLYLAKLMSALLSEHRACGGSLLALPTSVAIKRGANRNVQNKAMPDAPPPTGPLRIDLFAGPVMLATLEVRAWTNTL